MLFIFFISNRNFKKTETFIHRSESIEMNDKKNKWKNRFDRGIRAMNKHILLGYLFRRYKQWAYYTLCLCLFSVEAKIVMPDTMSPTFLNTSWWWINICSMKFSRVYLKAWGWLWLWLIWSMIVVSIRNPSCNCIQRILLIEKLTKRTIVSIKAHIVFWNIHLDAIIIILIHNNDSIEI